MRTPEERARLLWKANAWWGQLQELARETRELPWIGTDAIEKQIRAAIADEREECAKLADAHAKSCPHRKPYDGCCEAVADAIRARAKAEGRDA